MHVGSDGGDLDQRIRPRFAPGLGNIASPINMDGAHLAAEDPAQIDHRGCAAKRVANAVPVRDVGLLEPELADLSERLDEISVAWITAGDADADASLEQGLADVAADESAAAEHRYKLFVALDHGLAR